MSDDDLFKALVRALQVPYSDASSAVAAVRQLLARTDQREEQSGHNRREKGGQTRSE